jgi:GT2 family glycosyltransferase
MLRAHASLRAPGIIGNVQHAIRTQAIDHTGITISEQGKPRHDISVPLFPRRTKNIPAVTGACMLTTRKLWHELGGFDEQYLNGCEDIDLCFKALVAGYTNAVALRSSIFHHISPSPGRRRHDELNAQKLTLRWRSLLTELGARARCQDFLLRELNARAAYDSPWDCMQLGLHAAGFTRHAPITGLRVISNTLDTETNRWARMLP